MLPAPAAGGATPHGDGSVDAALGALDCTLGKPVASGSRGPLGEVGGDDMPSMGAGSEPPNDGIGGVGAPNDGGGRTIGGATLGVGGGIRSDRGG